MSIDTERYAEQYAGELRDRLRLDGLRSDLEFPTVMASSRRAARRRRAGIGGGLAAALALGVLASPMGLDAPAMVADAMRSARLSHVQGLAGDLSAPLHVAWTAQGFFVGVDRSAGTMLVSGGGALRALAADGTERWSTPVGGDGCSLRAEGTSAVEPAPAADPVVLCGGLDAGERLLLDPGTGAVLASLAIDWPMVLSVEPLGDDGVAAGIDGADRAVAARWHRDGSVVWQETGPVLTDTSGNKGAGYADSAVVVAAGGEVVRFDAATGEPVPGSGPIRTLRVTLPGGFSAVQSQTVTGPDGRSVEATGPDGSPIATIAGSFRIPGVDDGSVPGLLLVQDATTVRAMDLASDAELWHRWLVPGMVLDGRLLGWNSFDELQALDARTGEVLWHRTTPRTPTENPGIVSGITDGRLVVTLERDDRTMLVAVDAASGALRWSEPWEGGDMTSLAAVPGGVLASDDGTLTMLRP